MADMPSLFIERQSNNLFCRDRHVFYEYGFTTLASCKRSEAVAHLRRKLKKLLGLIFAFIGNFNSGEDAF